MNKQIVFLIDFDSTFITVESLDILAEIVLGDKRGKDILVNEIKKITNLGMEGKITFPESLARRMKLFSPTKTDVEVLVEKLHRLITPSVKKYQSFFKRHKNSIYILSSGFKNYMIPVVKEFGISEDHVLGNEFLFDENGMFLGYDTENVLAQEKGKVKKIEEKNFGGLLYMIGDGYTDWEVKAAGLAEKFFAFTENITRDAVIKKADIIAKNFDDVLRHL